MRFSSSPAITALAAASVVSRAHVVLENPRPFKFLDYGATNPIEPDGSNFPCKKLAGQTLVADGDRTVMAVGEPQRLSFNGTAVHGGGSCQLSLTRDLQPTPESSWMVIHSIEGGCPARNQRGNLDGPNVDVYGFAIPDAVAPGDYTFAWTWLNRIGGQPEFYMNCAPITVVAPAANPEKSGKRTGIAGRRATALVSKRADTPDFPELFMANMGTLSGGCTTGEALTQQRSIRFPNPGASVERPEGEDKLVEQPCDGNPRAAAAGPSSPPHSGPDDGTEPTSTVEPEPVPEPSSTTAVTVQPSDTTLITTTTTVQSPDTTSTPPTPPTTPIDIPTPTKSEIEPAPTTGGAACTEGYLTCMDDGLGFKTCTGGLLRPDGDEAAPVPVPGGYTCVPGEGVGLELRPI
ncbi:hypothetical protein DL771_008245 [Monosporascus sp. 5C6A]|nr:hypothetical protein DL771_008245 [Monosporascus sp. 5C6A]